MGMVGARVSGAKFGLSRLVQETSAVIRQPAGMSPTVDLVATQLVIVRPRYRQQACHAAASADHLQPSDGHGRVRRWTRSWKVGECVRKKVK